MKVRLLMPRTGPGISQRPGDEIEVSDAEAKRMMETSPPQAEPVKRTKEPEKAVTRGSKKRDAASD